MSSQQFLNFNVVKQLVFRQAKNLARLLFRDEAALDAEALLSDLLAAGVAVLLRLGLVVLLVPVLANLLQALPFGHRPDVPHVVFAHIPAVCRVTLIARFAVLKTVLVG